MKFWKHPLHRIIAYVFKSMTLFLAEALLFYLYISTCPSEAQIFFFFKFWMQRIADFSAKAPAHFLPPCAVLSWPTPPHGGHAGLLPAFTRALPLKHFLLFRPKLKRRSRSVAFAGVWALNFEKIKWPQRIQRETARERKKRKIKQGIGLQGGERAGESRAEPWNAFAVTSLPFP